MPKSQSAESMQRHAYCDHLVLLAAGCSSSTNRHVVLTLSHLGILDPKKGTLVASGAISPHSPCCSRHCLGHRAEPAGNPAWEGAVDGKPLDAPAGVGEASAQIQSEFKVEFSLNEGRFWDF